MPRPRRLDFSRAPGLSRISLSFMTNILARAGLRQLLDLQQVLDLVDHAKHFRRSGELDALADLVQPEANQGRLLAGLAPVAGRDLRDPNLLIRHRSPPRPLPCGAGHTDPPP